MVRQNVHYRLYPFSSCCNHSYTTTMHGDNTILNSLEGRGVVSFIVSSFDKLYTSGMLGIVKQEHSFPIDNLDRLVQCVTWHCHSES